MSGSRTHDPEVAAEARRGRPSAALRAAALAPVGLLRQRAVRLAVAVWCAVNVLVLVLAKDTLHFDWPALPPGSTVDRVVDSNLALLEVLLLMAVVYALTGRRVRPDVAARAGPGMIKTVLTLRTGNAWVHVWAYHALVPHTLIDTPHIVHVMHVR